MGTLVFVCPVTDLEVLTGIEMDARPLKAFSTKPCVARIASGCISSEAFGPGLRRWRMSRSLTAKWPE
jgi:hypothetical protein